MKKLLLITVLFAFIPSVHALQLANGLYFSMPENSVRCITILLPDNLGVFLRGEREYKISSTATWGDITQQVVRTDENNTVLVPLCISSVGRSDGSCAPPYTITVSLPETGASQSYAGGVCVNRLPDVEIVPPSQGQPPNPQTILNSNADIFDISFQNPSVYIGQGETAHLALAVESYANVILDLTTADAVPSSTSVMLSPSNPRTSVNYTRPAPGHITVTGRIHGCSGTFCTKQATADVFQGQQLDTSGFAVTIFPLSLNVRDLSPVRYQITVTNYGEQGDFDIGLSLPEGIQSGFQRQTVSLQPEEARTFEFDAVPLNSTALYEIKAIVSARGTSRQASAYLSTNELLTDAVRLGDAVIASNPSATGQVNTQLDSWYSTYRSSSYGNELDDYGRLQNSLNNLSHSPPPDNRTPLPPPPPPPQRQDNTLLISVIAIVIVIAVITVFFLRKRKPKEIEVEEIERY